MKGSTAIYALITAVSVLIGIGLSALLDRMDEAYTSGMKRGDGAVNAQRIITMSPALTECVYALGRGGRIVGVSQFSDWPPDARAKEQVGGVANPNFEKIAGLRPDVVLVQGRYESVREFCDRWGIRVENFSTETVADMLETLKRLGQTLGCPDEGEQAASRLRAQLDSVRTSFAGKARPKVFLVIGREKGALRNIYTAGGTSFLSELIEIAGGENIFKDMDRAYGMVSLESVTVRAPDVIMELLPGENLTAAQQADMAAQWQTVQVPAVRGGRVCIVTDDFVLKPGPRIVQTAALFARLLHGEGAQRPNP